MTDKQDDYVQNLLLELKKTFNNDFELLPTGKPNISFSELTTWHNCSWKHYLDQVLKLDPNLPGVYADYGKALHAGHEFFILHGELDKKLFVKTLYDLWNEHAKILPDKFTTETFKELAIIGKETLDEIPSFYNESFPGWKPIDAEHKLLEPIDNHPHVFKGYIDAIIEAPQKKKMLNYIIDAKTCSWGWPKEKKSDEMVRAQLILYKHYYTKKKNINPKDTRCAFILLKRTAKPGKRIERVDVSVGDVTTNRALKVVNNMIVSVKRGIKLKNKDSCKWCPYKDTERCI